MGKGITYTCQKCGKEKDLQYGIGMLTFEPIEINNTNKEKVLDICNETNNIDKNTIEDLINRQKESVLYMEEHKEYYCEKCNAIDTFFDFFIMTEDNSIEPKYNCKHCGNQMRLSTENDIKKIYCDKCKNEIDTNLKNGIYFLWD